MAKRDRRRQEGRYLSSRDRTRLMAETMLSETTIRKWEVRDPKIRETTEYVLDRAARKLGIPRPGKVAVA